jgi:hypothetical protein
MHNCRALHTDEEIARARRRIAGDPAARDLLDSILITADEWVARDDDWLAGIITPASVPRAFNVHHEGCPAHGREIFKFGNYSYLFSLDRPFKIVCPVGGEEYPSNDFAAYLATGMTDCSLLTGEYADDGWGWRRPGDEKKWWFVAYYNHWAWMSKIIPGILALSRAYLLTGRTEYAHKTALLLHRVADVYPTMDHNTQSRYATEFVPTYQGRIVNCIWECGVGTNFAEAYDNIKDAWHALSELEGYLGKSGGEIREHIECNLLDEVIDGVIAYMDNPNITIKRLMEYIPAPDFPTGGIIINMDDLVSLYESGEGKIRIRSKVEIENGENGRKNIVITEIPYTIAGNKTKLVEGLASLMKDKVFDEIYDIRDESSKEGIRIVIEVKKDRDIDNLLNGLYKKTAMEDTYAANFLAVKDKQPIVFNLKSLISEFVDFQVELIPRNMIIYLIRL